MELKLRWSIVTVAVLVCLAVSFAAGIRFAHHPTIGDFQTEAMHRNTVTVMRMRSALDAHHEGNNQDLYTTLCITLYTTAVDLLAEVDILPEDHRFRKSAVRLLGQAADYKKLHPESLAFLTSHGSIPPETVESLSAAIARLDKYANPAEQGAHGNPN